MVALINILLCGGSGTRLWPVSREHYPKQFNNIAGERSLFQDTLERNREFCEKSVIVTNEKQYFTAKTQADAVGAVDAEYILESVGRNTAPAITLACLALHADDIVLATPTDHYIKDLKTYGQAMRKAERLAAEGYIVTFGIKPDSPETGYGYIEANGAEVKSFREKPDAETAARYIAAKNYFWNSGMFAFKAGVFLDEMERWSGDILAASRAAFENRVNVYGPFVSLITAEYMEKIPKNSVDYAVMEKSGRIKMVAADMGWSDLGSFEALYAAADKDRNGNVCKPFVTAINTKNSLVVSAEKPVVLIDVRDLVVIDTADALLISKRGASHKVKDVMARLEQISRGITETHLTDYRPWGSFTVLGEYDRCKIKKISVKPQHGISLQKHHHRSEHWTVVSGTAKVTVGDKAVTVRTNESVYIPVGEIHKLENPGKLDLIIIETQVGDYLGEDDIVRLNDDYGRG
jgi:mannose-1-phosphate guanylyltransferase